MKVGIGLDGCLANTEEHFRTWKERLNSNADSFLHSSIVRDESFWRALPPYPDAKVALRALSEADVTVYVLTERPPKLAPITAAWLRVAGLATIQRDHIVTQTIKRYDCRLLALDVLFDSDLEMLKTFVYDETRPVYIDREGNGGSLNGRIRNEDHLDEAVENELRTYRS